MRIDGGTNVATMTDYLHTKSLDTSWLDDECGSVDESGWFGQIGRWVISVSTYGQRYASRFPTVALADAEMERLHAVCDEAPHVGHRAHFTGAWYCDTCDSPYCDLA